MKNIISAGAIVLPSTVGRLNVPLLRCRFSRPLPYLVALLVIAAMVLHGPIAQPAAYHQFADQRLWLGMAHAADVLSNLGFALVGTFGILQLWRRKPSGLPMPERCGYALFF